MWAGLLAASCTANGQDDSNIMLVDMLKEMSSTEALLFKIICEGFKAAENAITLDLGAPEQFKEALRAPELSYALNIQLEHLQVIGAIFTSYDGEQQRIFNILPKWDKVECAPTQLGLNLYLKCESGE